MTIHWKTAHSGTTFHLFRGKLVAGLLKLNFRRTSGYGELQGHLVRFETSGLWNPKTRILTIDGNRELGFITYTRWKYNAQIVLEGQTFLWKKQDWMWRSWIIQEGTDLILFQQEGLWKKQGTITGSGSESPVLLLAGLYIRSFLTLFVN